MSTEENQPRDFDAVLGGETPPPLQGVVLGGIEGVKRRLADSNIEIRLAALQDALNYQEEGLKLVVAALEDNLEKVRNSAYKALLYKEDEDTKQILKKYRFWDFWDLRERISETLDYQYLYSNFNIFYNLQVDIYDREQGLKDTAGKAYVINGGDFMAFLDEPQNNEIEALIFLDCPDNARLIKKDQLKKLKAIFYGPYYFDYQISWTGLPDIGYILQVYHQIEMLLIRGGDDISYSDEWQDLSTIQHENLKILIIESGGLGRDKIANIVSAKLPNLEHLEIWLGSDYYGGNSSIEDLMPILSGELYPNLLYLGLRNSQYSDGIARTIVDSSVINKIKVLDLSLGTLTDEGAEILFNCPAISNLEILNVADNCLSDGMIEALNNLDIEVIAGNQKRYWSVYE